MALTVVVSISPWIFERGRWSYKLGFAQCSILPWTARTYTRIIWGRKSMRVWTNVRSKEWLDLGMKWRRVSWCDYLQWRLWRYRQEVIRERQGAGTKVHCFHLWWEENVVKRAAVPTQCFHSYCWVSLYQVFSNFNPQGQVGRGYLCICVFIITLLLRKRR